MRLVRALEKELTEADELDLDRLFINASVVHAMRAAAGGKRDGPRERPRTMPSGALVELSPRSFTWPASTTILSSPPP